MSNIKELIRAEIRKWQSNIEAKCPESTRSRNYTKEEWNAIYEYNAYTRILSFIDTLPDEPVTACHELEEEIKEQIYDRFYDLNGIAVIGTSGYAEVKDMEYIARHFAEWQAKQLLKSSPLPEDTVLFQKGVEEGKRLMMEEAEECELYWDGDFLAIDLNMRELGYSERDKVNIIILPKEV